jgi:hypothetical protein
VEAQDAIPHLGQLPGRQGSKVNHLVDLNRCLGLAWRTPRILENPDGRPPSVGPTRLEVRAKDCERFRNELLEGSGTSLVSSRFARAATEAAASTTGILKLGRSQSGYVASFRKS